MRTASEITARARARLTRRKSDSSPNASLTGLHWLAAGLFLATGAQALRPLGAARPTRGVERLRRLPLALAPIAGAANAALAMRPRQSTRNAALVVNGVAIGIAAVGIAGTALGALVPERRGAPWHGARRPIRSGFVDLAAPIAFGATGLLGLLLEREVRHARARDERLQRKARVLDRIVPRRRARVDRVVVHV